MDTIKVRVLSRIKRDGKYIAAGSEITILRDEYEKRKATEAADSMLTALYKPVDEYQHEQATRAAAQAKKEGLGNERHAQVKANMQEANRVAQEAVAIKAQRDAEQARQIAEAAQARSDQAKPRAKRAPLQAS